MPRARGAARAVRDVQVIFVNVAPLAVSAQAAGGAPPASTAVTTAALGAAAFVIGAGVCAKRIYTLAYSPNAVGAYDDTWADGQDPGGKPGPAPNQFEPSRGFGKVWRDNASVKQALGHATAPEVGFAGRMQVYERGIIVTSDSGYTATGNGINGYWMLNTGSTRQWTRLFGPSRI